MTSVSTASILSFLEARIAEDEKQSVKHQESASRHGWGDYTARILSECDAKREIIELHGPIRDDGWQNGASHDYLWCGSCGSLDDSPVPFPCWTLKALAGVYKDHADYQQAWSE